MKSIAIFVLGFVFAGALASAQELTKQAKIERLLTVTKADAMLDQTLNQMKGMMASQIPQGGTPEQQARARELQGKILDLVTARMGWDKMRVEFVRIYDELFSDDEINGILAFYQSPAGRATLRENATTHDQSNGIRAVSNGGSSAGNSAHHQGSLPEIGAGL